MALPLVAVGGVGCQHEPPEDFAHQESAALRAPAPSAAVDHGEEHVGGGAAASTANALAGRCVQETPSQPPPAVAPGPAAGCPVDPEGGPPAVPIVHLTFPGARGVGVDAELVASYHDTMRGLMYRKSLGEDRGMLFDLQAREDHKFWMHNTCIPLDLLFIDEDGLIVGIVENAPTLDDTSRGVGCPSRWVLEVNAGWSRRHGIRAGTFVKLP